MKVKLQKIKEWISKEQDGLMDAQGNFEYPEHEGAYNVLCNLDSFIDSLPEEPVSEELEEACKKYIKKVHDELVNTQGMCLEFDWDDIEMAIDDAFKAGAQWQKNQTIGKAWNG